MVRARCTSSPPSLPANASECSKTGSLRDWVGAESRPDTARVETLRAFHHGARTSAPEKPGVSAAILRAYVSMSLSSCALSAAAC
eukprot:6191620-Pleurochrysis_carterae.AAC.1